MIIGRNMLEAANGLIGNLLAKHMEEIDKAYLKADDTFSVDIKLKFKPAGDEISMEAGIEFITDKVKDSIKGQMSENQMDLFAEKQAKQKAHAEAEEQKELPPATPELGSGKVIDVDFEKEEGAANDK